MKKLTILHVVPSFYPAESFGGPIASTKMICDRVSNSGFNIVVLTGDAESPNSNTRLQSDSIKNAQREMSYTVKFFASQFRGRFSYTLLRNLRAHVAVADVVHLTGPYSYTVIPTLLLAAIYKKPLIWSLRGGMLATRAWKKSPRRVIKYWFEKGVNLLSRMGSDFYVHVTSDAEEYDARLYLSGFKVIHIPNAIDLPDVDPQVRGSQEVRLLFLSRIHQKKGIEVLFEAIARLPAEYVLTICGDGEEDYINQLDKLAEDLGIRHRVTFEGFVKNEVKARMFCESDIFCLPSFSENYGIVIGEALSYGLPCVVSTETPWAMLEDHNCGFSVKPGCSVVLAEALVACRQKLGPTTSNNARRLIQREHSSDRLGKQFADQYKTLAQRSGASRFLG